VVFPRATQAVAAAVAIQGALAAEPWPEDGAVRVRIGVHAGEVEYDDRRISGITVLMGIRITGIAQPGEVFASHTVKELVAGSGITLTDRGTHILKGLLGEWRLFSPDLPQAGARTS
jgi:class 3 adenylate cyclase